MTTSVSLADIATRIDMLEIRCSRCDRAGRRRDSKLIEQHGGSMRLPDLRMDLVQGCDHANGHDYDRCDVFFPQLTAVCAFRRKAASDSNPKRPLIPI